MTGSCSATLTEMELSILRQRAHEGSNRRRAAAELFTCVVVTDQNVPFRPIDPEPPGDALSTVLDSRLADGESDTHRAGQIGLVRI